MEKLTALQGSQKLTMMIGVMPVNFDGIIEDIKSIGTLQGFAVNKEDKTAEFKNLLAEQETLEKTKDSYIAIKEKGGNIQDLLLLEDKILEIKRNLQDLGVNIGTYSTENSFCTINLSLNEAESETQETSLKFVLKCAKSSFFWTIWFFVLLVFLTLVALIVIVVFFKRINSIKRTMVVNKIDNNDKDKHSPGIHDDGNKE